MFVSKKKKNKRFNNGKNVSILDVEPEQDTYFVGELICVRANPEKVLPEYLFGFLSSEVGYFLLNREKRGQTSHIYPEDIKSILLPVPSLKDQKNIVSILMNAYEQKKKKQAEILKILSSIDDFVLGELGIDMPRGGQNGYFRFGAMKFRPDLTLHIFVLFLKC